MYYYATRLFAMVMESDKARCGSIVLWKEWGFQFFGSFVSIPTRPDNSQSSQSSQDEEATAHLLKVSNNAAVVSTC